MLDISNKAAFGLWVKKQIRNIFGSGRKSGQKPRQSCLQDHPYVFCHSCHKNIAMIVINFRTAKKHIDPTRKAIT